MSKLYILEKTSSCSLGKVPGGREGERKREGRESLRETEREKRENIVGNRYIYTYFLETSTWTPFERGSARTVARLLRAYAYDV